MSLLSRFISGRKAPRKRVCVDDQSWDEPAAFQLCADQQIWRADILTKPHFEIRLLEMEKWRRRQKEIRMIVPVWMYAKIEETVA